MQYSDLFTKTQVPWEDVVDCIDKKIMSARNEELMRPVVEEEVKEALFLMHPDKSLGTDGMTPSFFQKHRG